MIADCTTEPISPFDSLDRTAENHFRLLFYAAVFHLARYLHALAAPSARSDEAVVAAYPFLEGYLESLRFCMPAGLEGSQAATWWEDGIRDWESRCTARLPLRGLREHAGLTYSDQITLVLTGIVEEDIRFGSLFAALQDPLPSRRPCFGLLSALIADPEQGRTGADAVQALRRLMDAGLVVAENRNAPRAEWILRVPTVLWDVLRGITPGQIVPNCRLFPYRGFPPLKRLALQETLHGHLCRLPAVIAQGEVRAIVVRGMANSGRRTTLGALARALRRDLLVYDRPTEATPEDIGPILGPLCALTGALPAIAIDPAPGETVELPLLTGYDGPIAVMMRREGGVSGPAVERAITLTLPAPAPAQRRQVWQQTLGRRAGAELEPIVDRFLLPLGNVHRAARIATTHAALDRRETVTLEDVQLASRSLNRQTLDTLAQRLETSGTWSDLIVNQTTAAELAGLQRRCHHRERLLENLGKGFHNSVNRGVRALFTGPSGTGKTLAAKILAAVMQIDIYRVDMASIINKYIGETEKNLSQLLARAEEMDVLLLIDEGDSLMSNRTDVKSANDRYANLETNYLLQRLESYEGIVIVTTNAGDRIDGAFLRRFDILVEFQPPDAYERRLIWLQHLAADHEVREAFLQEIAQRCALTGGQIRNAALYAALLAVDAGRDGRGVDDSDLGLAVQREYRKAGASCPLRPRVENANRPMPSAEHLSVIT